MRKVIRIFSFEDHWVVVKGLTQFRQDREGLVIACDADNLTDALSKDPGTFDIILLDLMIPGTDPEENVDRLLEKYPGKPIVIFTSQENSAWEMKMYRKGVRGFLIKTCPRREFLQTIRDVYEGRDFGLERLPELERASSPDVNEIWDQLTDREKDILTTFIREENIKSIAGKMEQSNTRIYQVLNRIKKKLNVSNTLSLVKIFRDKVV